EDFFWKFHSGKWLMFPMPEHWMCHRWGVAGRNRSFHLSDAVLNFRFVDEQQGQGRSPRVEFRESDGPTRGDCRTNGNRQVAARGFDRALRRRNEPGEGLPG